MKVIRDTTKDKQDFSLFQVWLQLGYRYQYILIISKCVLYGKCVNDSQLLEVERSL